MGFISHWTWRVQSLPLLLWTPVLPQMSSAAGRNFDLPASVVCVCFSCDWTAYIHPGCWHSRVWAVLLGRLASLLTGPPLLSGHCFSCFKLVPCLRLRKVDRIVFLRADILFTSSYNMLFRVVCVHLYEAGEACPMYIWLVYSTNLSHSNSDTAIVSVL